MGYDVNMFLEHTILDDVTRDKIKENQCQKKEKKTELVSANLECRPEAKKVLDI